MLKCDGGVKLQREPPPLPQIANGPFVPVTSPKHSHHSHHYTPTAAATTSTSTASGEGEDADGGTDLSVHGEERGGVRARRKERTRRK